ncbi:toxin glutamine deamidase domain-containing protein [Streptomyces sp. NPDC051104]|uniref:toxin glutamine deamidase domain-containing protein n=1 Tax=Streptomyces sp. NPDC051104 TaxID=3155044 RepID=UPI0034345041
MLSAVSMMLPDELEWVLEMLGYRWPTADEDKLKECAALWRKFGDDVTELHTAANASARQVVAHNAGESIDAFTKVYAKFDGGGSGGYLANAAQAAYIIATVLEACAYLVEFAKWTVIAQLIALAIEIAAAQAAAPFTFGLSEVGALGATQATRLIVRRLLDELKEALLEAIVEAMKEPAISMIEAIITDLIRQTVNVGFGAQEGYDLATTVKKGTDSAWDAIKQTPQTLAEGVRDSLGEKAGHRAHHAIDSRIDGHEASGSEGQDGSSDNDGGSDSSGNDGDSDSSSNNSTDSSSSSPSSDSSSSDSSTAGSHSSSNGSHSSGPDSSPSTRSDSGPGTNIGGGISADTGGTHVGAPDLGAGPHSDSSGSDTGQNPSTSDIPTPRHTTSLPDFDDPAPSAPSHSASNTTNSSAAPSTSAPSGTSGGSSPSGITSPTPHATPNHAPSSGTASPAEGGNGGGGIGTSIDSLAAGVPTHSTAAPTPTTTDHSPGGTGVRPDGTSAMPASPTPPSTMDSGPAPRSSASAPHTTSSTGSPTSPTLTATPARNPSSTTPSTPSTTGTGPASTPSPTTSTTTPRAPRTSLPDGRTAGAGDGRTSGTSDSRTPGTTDGRIPTQRPPGTAPDGRAPSRTTPDDRTAPRTTPGTTAGDRTPPRNMTDERTTPRNTPGTTPGDRTAPRNTSDTTAARTPGRGQNPSPNPDPGTSPNRNPSPNQSPSQTSSPSSGGGPEQTSTPSNKTPNSSTEPGSTSRPGPTQTPTASSTPGTQPQPGTRPTPNRGPNQPAGTAPGTPPHPHAPQEPASQHGRSKTPESGTNPSHDPQHHQVTPVPIHTVPHAAPTSPPSHATHATPPPPGAPHTQPGASQQHPHQDSLNNIRNDLNHYPGGLTEPHPDDQQALVNAVPHNPDGTPQRFPDPFGHWSQLQNDGGNQVPGRSNNCADCSRSFLETWYGNPQVSAPRTLDVDENGNPDPWSPEHNANANQIRWAGASHIYAGTGSDPHTPARIAWDLQQAGHGSAAIVQVSWPGGGGHAFNAVNHHGHIIWIDTQSGEVSHQPLHIPNATGVWHIPLDANRNPIHPTQTDNDTTHHDSDTPQQGTDTSDQGPDNSSQANEDHKTPEPNPSHGTPDNAPSENPDHPESTPTAGTPSLTDTDGHTKDGPPHADTPKSEEPSRGRASDTAHMPDPNPPHISDDSRDGNGSDRDTSQTRSGAPTSDKGTRSDETDTHGPHTNGTISEHQTPSPTERSGAPDKHPVTDEATPSAPHAAPSGPTTHAPPAPAGAHQQAPEEPAAGSPNSAENSHTEQHDPAAESHHPLDDPSRTNHPRLTEPETVHSTHYGMLPMPDQQNLRQTNDVRQVGLDPVHQQLNGWLDPVPNDDGNGTRIPLVDALRECAPPRPDDPDHAPRILRHEDLARILPGFDDMHPGERGAVVASLARLSLNFHESHAVGASPEHTPGYPNHATKAHENAGWNPAHRREDPNESDDPDGLEKAIHEAFGKAGFTGALRDSGEHRPDFTGRNYAAVEVHDPASGKISYVVDSSYPNPGGGEKGKHSERNILDYLDTLNEGRPDGKKYEPLSMYSDREPCGRGQGYANCARLLSEKMPGVDVYYGTGYRKQAEVVDPDESPKGGHKKRFDIDLAKNIVALGKIWTRAMSEGGLMGTGTE